MALTSLVSEFMERKTFTMGQVIKKQSKYSPANTQYRLFYKEHASKFIERMKDWKTKTHNTTSKANQQRQQHRNLPKSKRSTLSVPKGLKIVSDAES